MLGIVSVEGVQDPCVSLKVNDHEPVVLSQVAALNVFMQMDLILSQLGCFPEDEEEDGVTLQ